MYEIKMTCYFNLHQVTALRMLYFSGFNLIWNFISLLAERRFSILGVMFWRLLGVSFSGIFIYGILLIAIQTKFRRRMSFVLPPAVWLMSNSLIFIFWNENAEKIIMNLSVCTVYIAAAALFALYISALFICAANGTGGKNHAFS